MTQYPVFAFLGWRFAIAAIVFAVIFAKPLRASFASLHRPSLYTGLAAGAFLTAGYVFQTVSLLPADQGGTTPARAAFLTGLYVVMVPVGQFVIRRQKPRKGVVIGVALALAGLWFLSGLTLSGASDWVWGDTMVLIAAFIYSAHMLTLGRTDESYSTTMLAFIQLVVVAVVCMVMSVVTQEQAPFIPPSSLVWFSIIITGVFGSAFAFGIQTWAHQVMVPASVALILVLEPAFGGAIGWLVAGSVVPHEFVGAMLMMLGMLASELLGTSRE
ncbi:MAG: DMT family transporter [Coriobacteriia bacterium]|nr:DMT family transporter [Coriobacteriia bacterium]